MSNEFPAFIRAEYVEGDAFSKFQRDLQQATDGFKRKFTEAGQEAQRAVSQALSLPRNSVGSLDLGVPQLRAAADAQQARAIAAREVAAATALAAKAEGDYSANARAAITATQALAREEEEAARAARAHADAAEQVQRALNLQKSATDAVILNTGRGTSATRINTESQRANRFAMIQAGQQLQDITISLQSGQRATTVFAQQLPQLAFAFTDVGGKVGAFAQFLAGPWGVAVFGAVTALGFLIEALVNSGSAAEKEAGALDFQITKVRELEAAIKKLNDAKVQQMQTSFEAERQALKEAESIRLNTINTLKQVEAKIALAVANARLAADAERNSADGSGGVAGRAGAQAGRDARIAGLQADLAAAQAALAEAERGVRVAQRAATDSATRAALDPATRVQRDYEKALAKEQKLMDAGSISAQAYAKRLAEITRARDAELKSIRETEKASRGSGGASLPPVTMSEVAGLLGAPIISGQRSAAKNKAVGGAANSLHLVGQAIDIPLTVDGKPLTKAGIRSALETAGIKVREILGPGDKNHDDHFHVGFDRKRQRPDQVAGAAEREAEQAAKALEALAGRVQNLQDRFDPATKAANDFAEALRTIKEAEGAGIISERQSFDLQISAMAQQAGELTRIQNEAAERFMKVFQPQDQLVIPSGSGGKRYEAWQVIGRTSEGRMVVVNPEGGLSTEITETMDDPRGGFINVPTLFGGKPVSADEALDRIIEAAFKDPDTGKALQSYATLEAAIQAAEQRSGQLASDPLFRQAEDAYREALKPSIDDFKDAGKAFGETAEDRWQAAQDRAANSFIRAVEGADFIGALLSGRASPLDLLRTINPGDSRLRTGVGASGSGIDKFLFGKQSNFREVAEGKPEVQPGFVQAYTRGINELQDAMRMALESVLGKNAANIGETLGSFVANGQIGSQIAGITGGNKAAGAVGGVLGSELGKTLASGPLGKALGSLSSALGPLGGIVGGIALGALGSALTPAKRGSATIGGSGGNLVVSSTRGNSQSRIAQSSESAGEAITTLERIAEALGGTVDASRGSVSIGVRDKNFRVDTSGQGITKTKRGAIDFGEDSAAAIKFATMDLIKDGVIVGLRASTQRLLQNSKDLDAAIQKAVDFQSVFDRLQARLDPVGAAISGIDREFSRLRNIFAEAAASTEELADLEKLYQFERADAVKEANERVMGSMKALLDDLRFGDNGRSLRDRLAAAQANFDPLAARVQSGDITAYDDFAEAARTLLDIQRQFSGSQTAFFDLQDRITAITAKVVEGGNIASILPGSAASAQADAQRAYDGSNVVSAIDRQTDELSRILTQVVGGTLLAINDNVTPGPVSGGRVDIPGFFAQNVRQI